MAKLEKIKSFFGKDKVLAGVCKKISDKIGISVLVIRLIFIAIAAFVTFMPTILAYMVLAFIFQNCGHKENNVVPEN